MGLQRGCMEPQRAKARQGAVRQMFPGALAHVRGEVPRSSCHGQELLPQPCPCRYEFCSLANNYDYNTDARPFPTTASSRPNSGTSTASTTMHAYKCTKNGGRPCFGCLHRWQAKLSEAGCPSFADEHFAGKGFCWCGLGAQES